MNDGWMRESALGNEKCDDSFEIEVAYTLPVCISIKNHYIFPFKQRKSNSMCSTPFIVLFAILLELFQTVTWHFSWSKSPLEMSPANI